MVSLTYRTQDLVKIDNESFELEHIFKCDRNILVLPHQFTKSVLGKVKRLTSMRQWKIMKMYLWKVTSSCIYCKISNIMHTKPKNLNDSRLVLQMSVLSGHMQNCIDLILLKYSVSAPERFKFLILLRELLQCIDREAVNIDGRDDFVTFSNYSV